MPGYGRRNGEGKVQVVGEKEGGWEVRREEEVGGSVPMEKEEL